MALPDTVWVNPHNNWMFGEIGGDLRLLGRICESQPQYTDGQEDHDFIDLRLNYEVNADLETVANDYICFSRLKRTP